MGIMGNNTILGAGTTGFVDGSLKSQKYLGIIDGIAVPQVTRQFGILQMQNGAIQNVNFFQDGATVHRGCYST